MDISAQVAARRAELARLAEEAEREKQAAAAEQIERERERRLRALDALADEISIPGTPVERRGEELVLAEESSLRVLDSEEFKRTALKRLLAREARQRWTPRENWAVIAMVTAGVLLLIPAAVLGGLLLIGGIAYRAALMKRYRRVLIGDYPQLFGLLAETDNSNS